MDIKVGQEVVVTTYDGFHRNPRYHFGWRVTRITPTGQIAVEHPGVGLPGNKMTRRFKPNGREFSSFAGGYHSARLETDVEGITARVAAEQATDKATDALQQIAVTITNKVGRVGQYRLDKSQLTAAMNEVNRLVALAQEAVEQAVLS